MLSRVAFAASVVVLAAAQNCGYMSGDPRGLNYQLGACQADGVPPVGVVVGCGSGNTTFLTNYSSTTCTAGADTVSRITIADWASAGVTVVCGSGSPLACADVPMSGYAYPPNCATGSPNMTTQFWYTLIGGVCTPFGASGSYAKYECTATGATWSLYPDSTCSTDSSGSRALVPGCNDDVILADRTVAVYFTSLCGKAATPAPVAGTPAPVNSAGTVGFGAAVTAAVLCAFVAA